MLRLTMIVTLLAVGASVRSVHASEAMKTEVDGTWELTSLNQNGVEEPETVKLKYILVRENGVQTITEGGEHFRKGHFSVDAKSIPKTITFVEVDGKGKETTGIYSIDGKSLKIAVLKDQDGKPAKRPKDFEPAVGKAVATYKKLK